MTGIIKSFFPLKNYGFINSDNKDYFFHRDDFIGHWLDLDFDYLKGEEVKVEFEEGVKSNKGLRAANVKRLDYPNQVGG